MINMKMKGLFSFPIISPDKHGGSFGVTDVDGKPRKLAQLPNHMQSWENGIQGKGSIKLWRRRLRMVDRLRRVLLV